MPILPTIGLDTTTQQHRAMVPAADLIDPRLAPEGYVASAAPPAAPVVGDRWRNSNVAPVVGVPPGSAATWNGTTWDVNGTGAPEAYTAAPAAPVTPAVGDFWLNTSGATVSGVPAGIEAHWSGVAWVFNAAGGPPVATDLVQGIASLSVGANYPASDTANNDVESTTPLYVKNAIAASAETFTTAVTAPVAPKVGDHWKNSSAGTVSGVPSGKTGVWSGAAWEPINVETGIAIVAASRNRMVPGELANPGAPQVQVGMTGVFSGTNTLNSKYTFTFNTVQADTAYNVIGTIASYDNTSSGDLVSATNRFYSVIKNSMIANKTVNGFELVFNGLITNVVSSAGSFWASEFNIQVIR